MTHRPGQLLVLRFVCCLLAAAALFCAGCGPANPGAGTAANKKPMSRTRAEFEEVFARWKTLLGQLRDRELAYRTAGEDARDALAGQYRDKLEETQAMENELLTAAVRAFANNPEDNADLKEFLLQVASQLVQAECYEDGLRVAQMLIDNGVEEQAVYLGAAKAAFACAEFESAERYLRIVVRGEGGAEWAEDYLRMIDDYREQWKREQRLREQETLAADLPRVILRTERGEIELELFENEAPNTVANFISLVESGFYDGTTFYKVTPELSAVGGCPHGDGSGSPGYFLPHEFDEPDSRAHFRGSLCTVPEGRYANGCQFQITFMPSPTLAGQTTVFGRVVRGLEVLAKLQRRGEDPMSAKVRPDRILSARVLRKRNHEYRPHTIPDPYARERQEAAERMRRLLSR
jgi:cyclophilin family peptidyl-prolyl cis-trans isomerase